ncbi:hypothetical protein F2Q69_00009146 [Brassica cretica]|uniref:Uncharacterized protein n=1 Tax=Brassica cretica TaxID=69181 RepID=A0A8S9NW43_BRACR|nr:hypothetical protein F2Q69_00009146 [Brassica cretica]
MRETLQGQAPEDLQKSSIKLRKCLEADAKKRQDLRSVLKALESSTLFPLQGFVPMGFPWQAPEDLQKSSIKLRKCLEADAKKRQDLRSVLMVFTRHWKSLEDYGRWCKVRDRPVRTDVRTGTRCTVLTFIQPSLIMSWETRQGEGRVRLTKGERSIWHIQRCLRKQPGRCLSLQLTQTNHSQVFSPQDSS